MIYNCTPHEITIYDETDTFFVPSLRKHFLREGASPRAVFSPTGQLLSAHFELVKTGTQLQGVDVKKQIVCSVDYPWEFFPEYSSSDGIIVSALYASAVKELGIDLRMYCVSNIVYENQSRPAAVGCLDIVQKF